MKFIFLLTVFLLSSCANLVNNIHRQIDMSEKKERIETERSLDPYRMYRDQALLRRGDKRPINNPVTYSNQQAAATASQQSPQNTNNYQTYKERVKARDLQDNGNNASLWVGENRDEHLFTSSDKKKIGDIIILEVAKDFKDEISNELKRAFPVVVAPTKPKDKKDPAAPEAATPPADPNAAAEKEEAGDKVYDKISTQVIEEISNDYMLLRGRKEVIFRQKKRFLEIQALVNRRDVFDGDKVVSDKVLERKVIILR